MYGKQGGRMRVLSKVAPGWWDYTTLDEKILNDAARLTVSDILQLERPGFAVKLYDTLESFYTAEALEYVHAWQQSTDSEPTGICGPIGPTEQLPLVAQIINDPEIDVRSGHFWAMDEWFVNGKEVPVTHPLSFARVDLDLCFNRLDPRLRMPDENLHFPRANNINEYSSALPLARMNTFYSCLKEAAQLSLIAFFAQNITSSYYVGKLISINKEYANFRLIDTKKKWIGYLGLILLLFLEMMIHHTK